MRIRRSSFFTLLSFLSFSICLASGLLWIASRRITTPARPSTANLQAALARTVGGVTFTSVTLSDAIDFLHDISGQPFEVDWKALEAAGIGRDTPCTLKVGGVTQGEVIVAVLASAGPGAQITAHGSVIRISAKGAAWDGSNIQRLPDPNAPLDPIRLYELQKRGNKPPPPPPAPIWETVNKGRRYTLVRERGALRLWSTPADPAAIYNQGPVGKAADPLGIKIVEFLGISVRHSGSPLNTWAVALPFWFFIAITAICPLIWLRRVLRLRRRLRLGQCPNCGYDIRATPDQCPECGRENTTAKADVTASQA